MAYTGFITQIKNIHKHPNADRLQMGECFGNTVIVGLEYVENQIGVYFPVDGQLSEEFCKVNDLVRRKDENGNNCGGYLDPVKRNIRAMKLRGERSDGLFLPLTCLTNFTKISDLKVGDLVDYYGATEICRKYIPITNSSSKYYGIKVAKAKVNFAPTFYEHIDTPQLAYNLNAFKSGDIVELTLKMHGTSGRTGYLPLVKTKKTWFDKLFKRHGKDYKEYGYVTGTRRVVLDSNHSGGFYDDNSFREFMAKKFEGKLHKGETVYYEIVGFQGPEGAPIMSSVKNSKIADKAFSKQYGEETVFSYGCNQYSDYEPDQYREDDTCGRGYRTGVCCDLYVYRMTMVNEDGDTVEYSPDQMRNRCEMIGVHYVPVFERFIIPDSDVEAGEYVVREVEKYFDGPDPIGKTHVREGVVARIINRPFISVYKHKNFSFKCLEGLAKDEAAAPDMEEAQEEISNEENNI